jgi:hypothetical protein
MNRGLRMYKGRYAGPREKQFLVDELNVPKTYNVELNEIFLENPSMGSLYRDGTADKGMDGDPNTTSNTKADANNWWSADLIGGPKTVYKVKILSSNLDSNGFHTIGRSRVYVDDDLCNSLTYSESETIDEIPGWFTIICKNQLTGSKIKV